MCQNGTNPLNRFGCGPKAAQQYPSGKNVGPVTGIVIIYQLVVKKKTKKYWWLLFLTKQWGFGT
jgi:hypothetical protein